LFLFLLSNLEQSAVKGLLCSNKIFDNISSITFSIFLLKHIIFFGFCNTCFNEHHSSVMSVCDIYVFFVMYSFPLNFSLFLKTITLQITLVFSDGVLDNLFHGMLSSKYFRFAQFALFLFSPGRKSNRIISFHSSQRSKIQL